MKCTNVLE
uniref:Uncharacterized protein n=1 Tax=Anguilla anguilla TaxID=7936 RepID=A0A0E9VGJ6_ANGAN